jgi:hypothetical protein
MARADGKARIEDQSKLLTSKRTVFMNDISCGQRASLQSRGAPRRWLDNPRVSTALGADCVSSHDAGRFDGGVY